MRLKHFRRIASVATSTQQGRWQAPATVLYAMIRRYICNIALTQIQVCFFLASMLVTASELRGWPESGMCTYCSNPTMPGQCWQCMRGTNLHPPGTALGRPQPHFMSWTSGRLRQCRLLSSLRKQVITSTSVASDSRTMLTGIGSAVSPIAWS